MPEQVSGDGLHPPVPDALEASGIQEANGVVQRLDH